MTETITARLPEELVKRVDEAVEMGAFPRRSEALRRIVEKYMNEHPEIFLESELGPLLGDQLSDGELEKMGAKLFASVKIAKQVEEGRFRSKDSEHTRKKDRKKTKKAL